MRPLRDPRTIALSLALVALSFVTYRDVPSARLADVDTPTVLLSNQIREPRDFLRISLQEIRRDVDPGVRFYRPITGLSYAIDQWVYGLSPSALHRVDLLLHGMASGLFALLLAGLGLRFTLVVGGGLLFALHPIGIEVLPAISRRADLLTLVLVLLSLLARLFGRSRLGWVAAALAPLAKESAFVLPLLWAALRPESWRSAARELAMGISAMLPALMLRVFALGGMGGYADPIWSPRSVLRIPLDLFDPQRLLSLWGARLVVVALLLLGVREALRSRSRALSLGLVWICGSTMLASFGGEVARWYLYGVLPACLLLLCAWIEHAERRVGALLGVPLTVAILVPSALWTEYPAWREAGRLQELWTNQLRERVQSGAMSEGEPVILLGVPMMVGRAAESRFPVQSVSVALGYSLRDALELEHGLELPVWCAVQVHLLAIEEPYALTIEPEGERLRVGAVGPVRLDGFDRLGRWRGGLEAPFRLERDEGAFVLSELEAPLWSWDGTRLTRVGP